AGVDHFESWMLASSSTPPLRDDLHMKISLCQPRNVPRLIDMVYGQELACVARLQDLNRLAEEDRTSGSHEWSVLMRVLARDAEVAFWNARIEWLQSARELLEQLHGEPDRPSVARPTDRGLRAC
ncbi:MAG TPA: hypothetical protein VGI24_11430, partial [Solirubrobacteraceae bacterium]